jgi:hypothetical protein
MGWVDGHGIGPLRRVKASSSVKVEPHRSDERRENAKVRTVCDNASSSADTCVSLKAHYGTCSVAGRD